ncbi:hypothetical protein GCM10023219_00400 [Stakelama sediminis]|uniref:Uncharacterized protein n=1 Tax=Stakelama sediminis TaxID=463200 RepID=A0A840Z0U6_9SPHN|nr:hypothetical protein [Stakelama sediminis]MBB5719523.1 hypothetical protein [Stakelama sediminis]
MSRGPDAATLLERALCRAAKADGCPMQTLDSGWRRWASATFTGARHWFEITLADTKQTRDWLAALPETNLPLSGHLVADLTVKSAAEQADGLVVRLEALTVEER